MRILVTGGSGFIGTNLIESLSREGDTIVNYSLHAPLDSEQTRYWQRGDILDSAQTTKNFKEAGRTLDRHAFGAPGTCVTGASSGAWLNVAFMYIPDMSR